MLENAIAAPTNGGLRTALNALLPTPLPLPYVFWWSRPRRPSEDELAGGEIANAHGMYVILEPKNKKVFHDPNNRTSLHRDR